MLQDFASQMCSLAENAGPLLVQALTAGGDQAKVAAYALTRQGICTNDTAQGAALDALFNAILSSDSETLFKQGGGPEAILLHAAAWRGGLDVAPRVPALRIALPGPLASPCHGSRAPGCPLVALRPFSDGCPCPCPYRLAA